MLRINMLSCTDLSSPLVSVLAIRFGDTPSYYWLVSLEGIHWGVSERLKLHRGAAAKARGVCVCLKAKSRFGPHLPPWGHV